MLKSLLISEKAKLNRGQLTKISTDVPAHRRASIID
jgi:hypothetical protein